MITERLVKSDSYETAFWMAGIYDPDYPLDELGALSIEVCTKLRALACYRLLKNGKTNSFYHNLIRSGLVRLRYLERCLADGALQDHFRGSGRYKPLCDAIAADEKVLAGRIAAQSPTEFMQGHEYEDDYCYAQILHGQISVREERAIELLVRFERYLEGKPNGRYLVARALTERNQADFDVAFEELLADRKREIAADIKRGEIESPHILMSRRVFVEGLAILRLAEAAKLETQDEYLFCPSIARVPMTIPFPGE
jgi:hypothetical protein